MTVEIDHAALEAMFKDPEGPVGQLVEKICIKIETTAKILVATPGSGRFYPAGEYFLKRGDKWYHWTRDSSHTASSPGEPPSSDTGRLMTAISHSIEVESTVVGKVVANTEYALWLELGTRYMEPRPFLRPALNSAAI